MDKKCAHCGVSFRRHPAVRHQAYCSLAECQRERKRRWQRKKLSEDADYRANQIAAQKAWGDRNCGYWRSYRERHPQSTDENRRQQRMRNWKKRGKPDVIAKMDELRSRPAVISGRYRLVPVGGEVIAKMDELIAEISVITRDFSMQG